MSPKIETFTGQKFCAIILATKMTHKKCYSLFKLFYTRTGNKICQKELDEQASHVSELVQFKTGLFDVTQMFN